MTVQSSPSPIVRAHEAALAKGIAEAVETQTALRT
jgi:hypothetical protein